MFWIVNLALLTLLSNPIPSTTPSHVYFGLDVTVLIPFQNVTWPDTPIPVTGLVNAFCLLLKVFQSVELRYPETDVVACLTWMVNPEFSNAPVPEIVRTELVNSLREPVVRDVQDKDPAVEPAVKNLPLLVVLVAGTWRDPSAVEWLTTPDTTEIGAVPLIAACALALVK